MARQGQASSPIETIQSRLKFAERIIALVQDHVAETGEGLTVRRGRGRGRGRGKGTGRRGRPPGSRNKKTVDAEQQANGAQPEAAAAAQTNGTKPARKAGRKSSRKGSSKSRSRARARKQPVGPLANVPDAAPE